LHNLYGPTEAAIDVTAWACRPADGAAAPPIGRPIWNTRVYVLDRNLEQAPLGVTGELYLAGKGLARGYLNRSALTAERFIADPYASKPGARMYRTGDLARWRVDGALEFVGRADRQIKIRGFRVELGEIENSLKSHHRVQDAIVTVHEHNGQQQLFGYVIAHRDAAHERSAHLAEWREIYESTYSRSFEAASDFSLAGWKSSYTDAPIQPSEMQIWVEQTVSYLRSLRPRQALEIGCGAGLLLTRMAAECDRYIGLDFSAQALGRLDAYLAGRSNLASVELRQAAAHELSFLADDSMDLVTLNSVVQYFPDIDYLLDTLAEAVRVTRPGGYIFVGDVRSLALLEAYHASVQLYNAAGDTSLDELRRRVRQARRKEKELTVAPELFVELGRRWKKIGRVETALKA
jgi:ubiquinone/menaquinone biosynthesis C-methylase UbiE